MSLRRSDGPNIDPNIELQSIRYEELLFRRQEWALGHAPIARVQEHESAPEWHPQYKFARDGKAYSREELKNYYGERFRAYWTEAKEATEAEKHDALRSRVRINVAAAFLCHRQAELRKHLPRSTADLKILTTEASGKLKYGFEDSVVEVTPRKLRDGTQAQDNAAAARLREATPDRALRKLCGKIKRRHQKMWRGEEEPVVAKAAGRSGTGAGEEPSPALAQLDDPVSLQRLQEYFEFLQSHRLLYCATCDEEWGVFDREWPQGGVATAGKKAGESECLAAAGFRAHSETSCTRCMGGQKTPYAKMYCEANLQHLGDTHPAISRLTWYESLLVARVHPVISVVTLLATGMLCFAGHVCNYYVKVFEWFRELPALLTNKKWFLVRRRRSLRAPAGRTRLKKPTTANRERLEAAFKELLEFMPNVYEGSAISPENLAHFPAGTEVEMEPEEVAPVLAGEVHVEPELFAAWLDAGAAPCALALRYHARSSFQDEARGSELGDRAFEFCYRAMYGEACPLNSSAKLGTQGLAQYLLYLMEKGVLPEELTRPLEEGALEDLAQRGKTIVTKQDSDELWVRWLKQLIHGELDAVREVHDQAEDLDVFASVTEAEQRGYSAEAEAEAARILDALDDDGATGPACAQTAQISLDTYGNVLGDAAEDEGDWPDDLAGLLIKAYCNPKTAKPFQVLFFGTSGTDGLRRFPPEAA